jgi:hypothetical protein
MIGKRVRFFFFYIVSFFFFLFVSFFLMHKAIVQDVDETLAVRAGAIVRSRRHLVSVLGNVATRFLEARCSHKAKRAILPNHSKL